MSKQGAAWGRWARRWSFRAVFTASMVVAFLAYGIPLWYHMHGERILVVTSGSMAPTFNTGDAVVIAKIEPSELRPGQVVTFWAVDTGRLTTHRIIDLETLADRSKDTGQVLTGQNTQYIRTEGDANRGIPDFNLTPVANVRGAVTEVKRGWGYPLGYAHSPLGRFLIFAPPLLLLLGAELMSWWRRKTPDPVEARTREKRDALVTPV